MATIDICARKRANRNRGNILTSCIADLIYLPGTHLYFLAFLFLSFGGSLGGLKASPGCTSHVNFLTIAHFAATLSAEVFSLRAFFPKNCSVGMCSLLPHLQCHAQTPILQLSPQPDTDVPLGCALPCTKLLPHQRMPGYVWILQPGIGQIGFRDVQPLYTFPVDVHPFSGVVNHTNPYFCGSHTVFVVNLSYSPQPGPDVHNLGGNLHLPLTACCQTPTL